MKAELVTKQDNRFMMAALELAEAALSQGEFPVGCVIANGRAVIAQGHRTGTANGKANEIDHAEINAIRCLYETRGDVAHSSLTVYCTLEPCLMCFSAILLSNINRIVYSYEDVMGGGTRCDRSSLPALYCDAPLTIVSGLLREKSLLLFNRFFSDPNNHYWADSLLSRYTLDQSVSSKPGLPA